MSEQGEIFDLTSGGVHFADRQTGFENDDLTLLTLNFARDRTLTAIFNSAQTGLDIRFTFRDAGAFRVLDEGGLLELWAASKENPRPAQTTFLVRGHIWQWESPLVWLHSTNEPYFSYLIATDWDCLEVVSSQAQEITTI